MSTPSARVVGLAVLLATTFPACRKSTVTAPAAPAEQAFATQVIGGAERTIAAPPLDSSVSVSSAVEAVTLVPGKRWTIALRFQAPGANVVGLGIRLVAQAPVSVFTSSSAQGRTEGVLSVDLELPTSLCDGIGAPEPDPEATDDWSWRPPATLTCHQLEAQIFAVTAEGGVSAPAAQQLGLRCNGCEERTCAAILAECRSCLSTRWVGGWSAAGQAGALVGELQQSGTQVTGTMDVRGVEACGIGSALSGRVEDNLLSIGSLSGGGGSRVEFSSEVNLDCSGIRGSFQLVGGLCDGRSGRFELASCAAGTAHAPDGSPSAECAGRSNPDAGATGAGLRDASAEPTCGPDTCPSGTFCAPDGTCGTCPVPNGTPCTADSDCSRGMTCPPGPFGACPRSCSGGAVALPTIVAMRIAEVPFGAAGADGVCPSGPGEPGWTYGGPVTVTVELDIPAGGEAAVRVRSDQPEVGETVIRFNPGEIQASADIMFTATQRSLSFTLTAEPVIGVSLRQPVTISGSAPQGPQGATGRQPPC